MIVKFVTVIPVIFTSILPKALKTKLVVPVDPKLGLVIVFIFLTFS